MLISAHRKTGECAEAMTNKVPDTVCQFLDIEAQVDNKDLEDNDRYG